MLAVFDGNKCQFFWFEFCRKMQLKHQQQQIQKQIEVQAWEYGRRVFISLILAF